MDQRRRTASRPSSTVSYSRNDMVTPAIYAPSPVQDPPSNQTAFNHQDAMDRFTVIIRDLEAVMIQLPVQSLAALPPNHDIRHLVRQILFLAAESIDRHRTPLLMSQKIVQLLYKTSSQLGREVYVALLDQLCHSFEDVAKEAITWLLYAEDEVYPCSISLFYSTFPHNANISLAKVQCTCYRDTIAKWPGEYLSTRSATRQKSFHGAKTQLAELRCCPHP